MKTYTQIRQLIKTGDVFLTSQGLWGAFIRLATLSSHSHIALLHWNHDVDPAALWVSEMRGRPGHQAMPASQWVKENSIFEWGTAPQVVRDNPDKILEFVARYRAQDPDYSWWALPIVWASHITGAPWGPIGNVCSTYIEKAWQYAKYRAIHKAAAPDAFRKHCGARHYIEGI